jgi:hypothetical protein
VGGYMSQEVQAASKIAIFKGKKIRKTIHNDEWYFSIIDVIEVLTESSNSRRYWSDLKTKLIETEGFVQLYDKIVQLKLIAPDGKMRETELGEASTTEIATQRDAQGFDENKQAAKMGGTIAGNARKELEIKSGKKVVSSSNFFVQEKRLKELDIDEDL